MYISLCKWNASSRALGRIRTCRAWREWDSAWMCTCMMSMYISIKYIYINIYIYIYIYICILILPHVRKYAHMYIHVYMCFLSFLLLEGQANYDFRGTEEMCLLFPKKQFNLLLAEEHLAMHGFSALS